MSEVAYPRAEIGERTQGELELELELERTREGDRKLPQGQSTFQKTTHQPKEKVHQSTLSAPFICRRRQPSAKKRGIVPRLNPAFPILSLAFGTAIIEETGRVIYAVSYWYCMSVRCDPANFFRVTSLG